MSRDPADPKKYLFEQTSRRDPDKVNWRVGTPPRAPWSGSDPARCELRRIFFAPQARSTTATYDARPTVVQVVWRAAPRSSTARCIVCAWRQCLGALADGAVRTDRRTAETYCRASATGGRSYERSRAAWRLLAWNEDVKCCLVRINGLNHGRLAGARYPFLRDAYRGGLWGQLTLPDWANLKWGR